MGRTGLRFTALQHQSRRDGLLRRFQRSGLEGLSEADGVELLLALTCPGMDVRHPAEALLGRFGNLKGVLDAAVDDLARVEGLPQLAASVLKVVRATATRYLEQSVEGGDVLREPEQLLAFWRMRIGAAPNEVFEIAYLDAAFRLMCDGVETLTVGTVDRATVYPRRVIEAALRRGAVAIVLAHNHPDGRTAPSEQDQALTRVIVLAAETV